MRRSLRRYAGPLRGNYSIHFLSLLLLLLLLSAGGSAQTIRHGPTARTHRIHRPDFPTTRMSNFLPGIGPSWAGCSNISRMSICCSQFGGSVGISGDTIVVGDTEYPFTVGGYIFVKPISGWKNMVPTRETPGSAGGSLFRNFVLRDRRRHDRGRHGFGSCLRVREAGGRLDGHVSYGHLEYRWRGFHIRVVGFDQWRHNRRRG